MVRYGTLWYVMVHYGTLWYIMVHYGTLWYIMVHYGTFHLHLWQGGLDSYRRRLSWKQAWSLPQLDMWWCSGRRSRSLGSTHRQTMPCCLSQERTKPNRCTHTHIFLTHMHFYILYDLHIHVYSPLAGMSWSAGRRTTAAAASAARHGHVGL